MDLHLTMDNLTEASDQASVALTSSAAAGSTG
ncbi:MAG: hypothetical protein ACJARU_001775, partial [Congregibacter sp.]